MRPHLAVVTGANRGLGLETGRELASRGWRVVLAARRPVESEAAAAALRRAGRDAVAWPLTRGERRGAGHRR